jgi:hypothetical protein
MRAQVCRGHPGGRGLEEKVEVWTPTLAHYTGYTEHEIPSGALEAMSGSVPSLSRSHPLCPIASL